MPFFQPALSLQHKCVLSGLKSEIEQLGQEIASQAEAVESDLLSKCEQLLQKIQEKPYPPLAIVALEEYESMIIGFVDLNPELSDLRRSCTLNLMSMLAVQHWESNLNNYPWDRLDVLKDDILCSGSEPSIKISQARDLLGIYQQLNPQHPKLIYKLRSLEEAIEQMEASLVQVPDDDEQDEHFHAAAGL